MTPLEPPLLQVVVRVLQDFDPLTNVHFFLCNHKLEFRSRQSELWISDTQLSPKDELILLKAFIDVVIIKCLMIYENLPLHTKMSHWKCTLLLSGNLNMEYSFASAFPFGMSYLKADIIFFSGHLKKQTKYIRWWKRVVSITFLQSNELLSCKPNYLLMYLFIRM